MDAVLGGVATGMVWGWLVALRFVLTGARALPARRRVIALCVVAVASLGLGAGVFWAGDAEALTAFAGGAAGGWCLHAVGLAHLRRTYESVRTKGG